MVEVGLTPAGVSGDDVLCKNLQFHHHTLRHGASKLAVCASFKLLNFPAMNSRVNYPRNLKFGQCLVLLPKIQTSMLCCILYTCKPTVAKF